MRSNAAPAHFCGDFLCRHVNAFESDSFVNFFPQDLRSRITAREAEILQTLVPSLDSRGKGLLDLTEVQQVCL